MAVHLPIPNDLAPACRGTVARSARGDDGAQQPAVLLVGPPAAGTGDASAPTLLDAVEEGLLAGGLTVVRPDADAWRDPEDASTPVDAAVHLLAWMQSDAAIDPDRIGALGIGDGAIVVSCAAGARPGVNRVVLVAPTAPDCARTKGADDGANEDRCPALLASIGVTSAAAPLSHHAHPVLVIAAAADRVTPPDAAHAWVAALEHAERQTVYEQVGRADHDFTDPDRRAALLARVSGFVAAMDAPVRAAGAA